jgi:23S rRNA (uracil-5-)-methyltransferase RumA
MALSSNKQAKSWWQQQLAAVPIDQQVAPVCAHFGECGGCTLQHIAYNTQLELKTKFLTEVFSELAVEVPPVVGSPKQYEYRLKMDYVISFNPTKQPQTKLGLRHKGSFNYVVDLHECHLISAEWYQKLRKIYEFALELEIPGYDLKFNTGNLRYFTVRIAAPDAMLTIVTKDEQYISAITKVASRALELGFTSVKWLLRPQLGDDASGLLYQTWGKQQINIAVNTKTNLFNLEISENNFFQNNIAGLGIMLGHITDLLSNTIDQNTEYCLLDMYCGVGTLGIGVGKSYSNLNILGVDIDLNNIIQARNNSQNNNITGIYECLPFESKDFLSRLQNMIKHPTIAIVDPPRVGLLPGGVSNLLQLAPEYIVYVSCNPLTQVVDLIGLQPQYEILSLQGFDMFPQALHLENIVLMRKR